MESVAQGGLRKLDFKLSCRTAAVTWQGVGPSPTLQRVRSMLLNPDCDIG
jgi:hypothetical protein